MKFVTLFLKTENVHLLKDVGMIPCHLHNDHGWDCSIASYRNTESYSYLEKEAAGITMDFVPRTKRGIIYDGITYLRSHAREIDVLNIYHLNLASYFYGMFYKHYNPKGILYLKIDMNPKGFITCFKKDPRGFIKRSTIRRADLVSVETRRMYEKLHAHFGPKVIRIPNGSYADAAERPIRDFAADKENTILTVGNLGTYEKATDLLLTAFADSAKNHDYKLRLVGPIAEPFQPYMEEFLKTHKELRERIIFTGPVYDKAALLKEYEKARFFTLPSLSEGFPIAVVEAAREGCYLITGDMVYSGPDVNHDGQFGTIVKSGDMQALSQAFTDLCTASTDYTDLAIKEADHVRSAFDWCSIVQELVKALTPLLPGRNG